MGSDTSRRHGSPVSPFEANFQLPRAAQQGLRRSDPGGPSPTTGAEGLGRAVWTSQGSDEGTETGSILMPA